MEGRLWRQILARYGQKVTLWRGEKESPVRAFFQPVAEKKPEEEPTPLGVAPRGKYLYLGPAEETREEVEELTWEDRAFRVLRHRGAPVGEGIAYQWAVCEVMDEVRA